MERSGGSPSQIGTVVSLINSAHVAHVDDFARLSSPL
jgi:hypothetical protein